MTPLPRPSPAVPPVITTITPSNSTALENTQHSITCAATGDPTPRIVWSFEGRAFSNSGVLLSFISISREDTGVYTCTASNAAGAVSAQVYVDVQCEATCQHVPGVAEYGRVQSVPICALNSKGGLDRGLG